MIGGNRVTAVMEGVRVLEVAEHTFVPAASALLADWGAEIIKIEHVSRGDAMRGLASTGVFTMAGGVHALMEHSNRGKKSLALDLTSDDGLDILYKLAATSDVFLTNKLPSVRDKLKIGVEEIRAHNPRIIYVRGTGQGERGPEADRGSYDSLAFWARSGIAVSLTRPEYGHMVGPPGPGFGDSIGAMTIAGGIMGALFHRERTGEATVVDVSLLGSAMWAMGQGIALSLLMKEGFTPPPEATVRRNPLVNNYLTEDGRYLSFCCLQAGKYWAPMCEVIGRPDLASDPRFAEHESLLANSAEAIPILEAAFASESLATWRSRLEGFVGQWTVVQNTLEVAEDAQSVANGYIQECATSDGTPFWLASAPVQFNEEPPPPGRSPEFNEHGDEILSEIGLDWETILDLKVRGVVA
jgi:crotonobetainyl-CoA:carnitine CoA-transferase CaiB-like acyl-CoA transferase